MGKELKILITFQRDPRSHEFVSFKIRIPEIVVELTPEKLKEIRGLYVPPAEVYWAQWCCKNHLRYLVRLAEDGELGFIYREEESQGQSP